MLLWLMLLLLLLLLLRLVTAALMVVATLIVVAALLRLMLLRRLTMLRLLIAVLRRLLLVGLLLLIRLLLAALTVAVILAAHLVIGRRHRPLLTHRVALALAAIGLHDPVIMLGMLVEILGGDAVTRRGGFARHRDVAFEHLIRVAANLHARSAAVEIL